MTTDIKQINSEKLNKGYTIVCLIISALLSVAFLTLFIFTNQGIFRLIISGMWFIYNLIWVIKGAGKNHIAISITSIFILIPILFFMSLLLIGLSSETPFRYNFQKQYITSMNGYEFDILPEKLPDDISDYFFSFKATVGQGAGHSSVRFKASHDVIKAYEEEYSAKAIYTYPYSEFEYGHSISVDEVSPKAESKYEDHSLGIYSDTDFWAESTSATVYVTSATHYWNHPHSTAVIIDSEKNMIEFARLG